MYFKPCPRGNQAACRLWNANGRGDGKGPGERSGYRGQQLTITEELPTPVGAALLQAEAVETGLNSSEVLATLFNLERKGIVRQLPGKQFSKVLM